jgi:hypothetical protein
MKKLTVISLLIVLNGCAMAQTEIITTDASGQIATIKRAKVYSFFSRSALEGFEAGKETKTTGSLISLKKVGTETEAEKLSLLVEAATKGAAAGATGK